MYQREFKQKIKIGIVGTGSHMYRNLLPACHYLPIEIVAMCNRSKEKLAQTTREYRCAGYTSTDEMYKHEDLDAVIISVSPQQHPALTEEALSHGLHVFMEKPPAMRAYEIEDMMRQQGDRVVAVGFKKAFTPAAVKIREILHERERTPLLSVLGVYPMTMPENGVEVLQNREFTNWLGNGCHPLSMLLSCAGPVRSVTTHRGKSGQGCVVLGFESGVMGTLHLAQEPEPMESYHFYGGQWSAEVLNSDHVILHRGIPFDYAYTNTFAPEGESSGSIVWRPQNCLATLENKSLFVQGMVEELYTFCQAVLGVEPLQEYASLKFALQVMRVYEAAVLSDGKSIEI